ncbi:MAG: EAL and HDOD domain-containing protein [Kineosporiaceae bacterium]
MTVLELTSAVQVARQPLHDWQRSVVGYGLCFRHLDTGTTSTTEGDWWRATGDVVASVLATFRTGDLAGERPLFVTVPRPFLVGERPLPEDVEPGRLVLAVPPDVTADDELLAGLRRLLDRDLRVAVAGYSGQEDRTEVARLSDVVTIDLGQVDIAALPRVAAAARRGNSRATLAVDRVEDCEGFEAARDAGAEIFSGYHLQRPPVVDTAQLAPSKVMCLRLLGMLSGEDVSMTDVEAIVAGDPGLAVRVLRTASSASAAGRPVSSLRQALALIGPRMLSSWVVLMLVGGTGSLAADTVVTLLARAGTCAGLAPAAPHIAYTVGLLAGVSDSLGMSAVDTVRTTGVGPEVADALISGEGAAGVALRAVLAHERGNPQAVAANGFTPYEVSRHYLEAVRQAMPVALGIER